MNTFCSIITPGHFPFLVTSFESLYKYDEQVKMQVLIAGDQLPPSNPYPEHIIFYRLSDVDSLLARQLHKKYFRRGKTDAYRWSMKSVFIDFLLSEKFESVIFIDPDIYFFQDFKFLFDYLDTYNLLITPHWRSLDPFANADQFHQNSYHGIYNGGFVGANRAGREAMRWWARACLYKCQKSRRLALYVDQGYLDMFPLLNDRVKVVRHRGCNVANWNRLECKREMVDGEVLINGEYPVVFIHFTADTLWDINNGNDGLLKPHLDEYAEMLKKHTDGYDIRKAKRKKDLFKINRTPRSFFGITRR